MNCFDCPYGYDSNPTEEYVWCDKVGGKTSWYGFCSDLSQLDNSNKKKSRKKRINKWERKQKYRNHLKKLHKNVGHYYLAPVWYKDKICIHGHDYVDNQKPYYKRLYRRRISPYLKMWSNRKIRRYKGELHKGAQCFKLYDFWWELT